MRVWMRLSVERERRAALAIFAISFLWGMTFIWMKQGIEAAEVLACRSTVTTILLCGIPSFFAVLSRIRRFA